MDVGLSVSRVGGAAQTRAMKQVAGMLRLDLAYYHELQAFAQFATELDRTTRDQLARGERMMELLTQPQYSPMPMAEQVVAIHAGTQGYLDELEPEQVAEFGRELVTHVRERYPSILSEITDSGALSEDLEARLKEAIEDCRERFRARTTDGESGS